MSYFMKKRVLITGASSGIGRLLAFKLADMGADVIIWGRDSNRVKEAVAVCRERTGNAIGIVCDISSKKELGQAISSIKKRFKGIDILINNAGVVSGKYFLNLSDKDIEQTIKVNLLPLFYLIKAFLPGMLERNEGQIVNISSAAGIVGTARLADYSAAKFGVFGLTESLHAELRARKSKVKTTIVCPYYVDTGMFSGAKTRFSFLLPILTPDYCARKIIKAIEKKKPRLIMPRFVYLCYLPRLFPVKFFDLMMDLFGISRSMKEFRGKKKKRRKK